MAGRGCTIEIRVLNGALQSETSVGNGNHEYEKLYLPVALHSPLEILQDEIERVTNIAIRDQVLILLNLSDPERNSDVLLSGKNHLTLRQCGICNNSVLTVHALGATAEKRIKMTEEVFSKPSHSDKLKQQPLQKLVTGISPAQANHSYNGIVFDIEARDINEIEIESIWLGGMLGPMVLFND